jgi:DNA-binding response OmpR family regulator
VGHEPEAGNLQEENQEDLAGEAENLIENQTTGDVQRDAADVPAKSASIRPTRRSLWGFIQSWFRPNRREPIEQVEVTSLTLSPAELEARVASATLQLEQSEKRVLELQELNQRKQVQSDFLQSRVGEIQEFISKVERSYFWKVQQKMEKGLTDARNDLESFEQAVKDVKIPEPGLLIKLRKSFHKIVAIAALISGLVAVFTALYPTVANFRAPQWLQTIFDSTAFSSILVAMVVAAYGLIFLVRKFAGKDAFPVRRVVVFTVIVIALAALFIAWPVIEPEISKTVIPFLRDYTWQILAACGSIFLFALLVALLVYYSGWSGFRRDVAIQLTNLSNVIQGYVKTKQEVDRLEKLYKQTSDWLEILAHSLYRPWKIHPDWESTREFENHYSTFPFALRVAQAKEERDSRMAELERLVGARLMVQGWRADAFNDMVENAGLEMGMQEGKFTTVLLDADLPHETNNSRALLLRFLDHSANSEFEGRVDLESTVQDEHGKTSLKPSDKYLVEVARLRLLDLIEKTQSIVLSEARPRVLHIQDDPLADLREDQGGIEEYDPTHSWDDFLKESLGTDEVTQPPMGILNFSENGLMSRVQEDPTSFIVTPKRLYSSLPPSQSERISVVPVGDEKPRAVEIIVRVDVVGPLSFDQIALLSGDSPVNTEQATSSWESEQEL